jgi:hypothetical protein
MKTKQNQSKEIGPRAILLFGFLFATILFIMCVIARPESLGHNDGLSYFGAIWWTVVPYTLAFLTYALCCFVASRKITNKSESAKTIKLFLVLMSLMLVGLIITPHTVINSIHKVFGSTLFASQLLLSLYLLYKNGMNYFIFIMILIMFTSGIFSAAYLASATGFMIQAQIIYQIAFVSVIYFYLGQIKKLK